MAGRGALAMGMMGGAGGTAIPFLPPRMGAIFDAAKAQAAGGIDRRSSRSPRELWDVTRHASVDSFQSVAIAPLLLLPVFGAIWLSDRRRPASAPIAVATTHGSGAHAAQIKSPIRPGLSRKRRGWVHVQSIVAGGSLMDMRLRMLLGVMP